MESYIDSAGLKGPCFPVDRVPPHSDEIEQIVLGMIVHAPHEVAKDIERFEINLKSFYALRHKALFKAIDAVRRDKMVPDELTVWKRLQDEGAEADIIKCLHELPEPPTAPFEQFARQLNELRHRRHIIACVDRIRNCAHDPPELLDVVAGDLARVIEFTHERGCKPLTMRKPEEIMAMSFDDSDCYVGIA